MFTKILLVILLLGGIPVCLRAAYPSLGIAGINVAVNCNTSVLINFNTTVASHAYLEYGLTAGYGNSTIDDSARFYKEHAIQITGLTVNTLYHYRVVATDITGTVASGDQTFTTTTTSSSCPTLPTQVDSRMPDMTGATEKTVKAAGGDYTPAQFQTALNDAGVANEKRIITVDAGLTLAGSWTMPANADQNWIVIRSAATSLTEGKRVFPSDSSSMFRIQNTNVDPTIAFAAASNHIRIIGAEITIDPAALADAPAGPEQGGLVQMQTNLAGSAANLPKFVTFDRCYVHGLFNKNTRRGIYAVGEDIAIIDSYLEDFHAVGGDAQAILFVDVQRGRVLNNTLIGSGENFMWGGTGLSLPGYVIGNLEFLRNQMYHPIAWYPNSPSWNGFDWTEKNLFELKTSAKVLAFGNYFGGTSTTQGGFWPDAQSLAVNLKLEQNSVGPTTCDLMEDITFYKNYGRNLHAGTAIVGRTNSSQGCTNVPTRVQFLQNTFELNASFWTPEAGCSSCSWNATGWALSGTTNLQVFHNTTVNANPPQGGCIPSVFTDGMLMLIGDPVASKISGFVFRDNITDNRGCGVVGGGFNGNNVTGSLNGVYIGWVFTNNGIMRALGPQAGLPPNNLNAITWTTQVLNFNGGLGGDYRVSPSSSWANAASDGTDVGADILAVERAVEFTPSGNWSATGGSICRWSANPTCQ